MPTVPIRPVRNAVRRATARRRPPRPREVLDRVREDWSGLDRGARWFEVVLILMVAAITFAETLLPVLASIGTVIPFAVRASASVGGAILALALRRTYPITALVVIILIGGPTGGGILATIIAVFGVGYRVARASTVVIALVLTSVTSSVFAILVSREPDLPLVPTLLLGAFVNALPALLGRYRRGRSALILAGWERAHHLEREQEIIAEQARLRERARIAQDMHDSLGHDLSLIALQAGSLEVAGDLAPRHQDTARLLRSTTAVAMSRLRSVIGILREEAGASPPDDSDGSEDVAALPRLVERSVAAGADVILDRPAELDTLPSASDRAIYRVVQEALTNVTKHAPGARTVVSVRPDERRVVVEITNAAPSADADPSSVETHTDTPPVSGGRGLVGIAERVRLAGGHLDAGPYDGGFRVTAQLPSDSDSSLAADSDTEAPLGRGPGPFESVHGLPAYPGGEAPVDSRAGRQTMNRLRSAFWLRLVLPGFGLLVASAVIFVMLGVQISTVPEAEYEKLRTGQPRADVERMLPPPRIVNEPALRARPTPPDDADCELYLPGSRDIYLARWNQLYRLCYVDGRLISKNIIGPRNEEQGAP